MKVIKVTDQTAPKKRVVKRKAGRLLTTGAMLCLMCLGCGIGLYTGVQIAGASTPNIKADMADTHIVEEGETLWDIARPVADAQGQDIREIMFEIQVNNDLDDNCTLKPGQRLIIRY